MKEQIVIRSFANNFFDGTENLVRALNNGYKVVMGNPVGKDVEYILERETEDLPTGSSNGKWYAENRDDGGVNIQCSECGHCLVIRTIGRFGINENTIRYCSSCGAKMKNVEEVKAMPFIKV